MLVKRNEKCAACFNYHLYFNNVAICLANKCNSENFKEVKLPVVKSIYLDKKD